MKIRSLFLALLLFSTFVVLSAQNRISPMSEVTVKIVSNLGNQVSEGRLIILKDDGSVAFSQTVAKEATVTLEYGKYLATFETRYWQKAVQEIIVDQPTFFVIMPIFEVAVLTPIFPTSFSVKVQPQTICSGESYLWAKLVGIYSHFVREERIGPIGYSPVGYARFHDIVDGRYMIMIVDGNQVRASKVVTAARPDAVFEFALPACPAQELKSNEPPA